MKGKMPSDKNKNVPHPTVPNRAFTEMRKKRPQKQYVPKRDDFPAPETFPFPQNFPDSDEFDFLENAPCFEK